MKYLLFAITLISGAIFLGCKAKRTEQNSINKSFLIPVILTFADGKHELHFATATIIRRPEGDGIQMHLPDIPAGSNVKVGFLSTEKKYD